MLHWARRAGLKKNRGELHLERRLNGAARALLVPGLALALAALGSAARAGFDASGTSPGEFTATGQSITPSAARGAVFQALNPDLPTLPDFTAGQAAALALSPDGRTLLILTSGYNRNFGADGSKPLPELSNEYVFVYDVSGAAPVKRQVL